MTRHFRYLLAVFALLLPFFVQAQVVQIKGTGTVSYAELTPAIKERAYVAAQMSAVERYFAENGESQTENFEANQDKIQSNLDKFLLSTTVINEQDQPSVRKYSVAVRVELNVAKLRNTLRNSSAAGSASVIPKSQLVYVFAARESASVRQFDARVVKRVESTGGNTSATTKSTSGSEGESITDTSISTSASKQTTKNTSSKSSSRVESGGSVTRRADETTYRIVPMGNFKTSITSVFSQGGFKVADPEFVLGDQQMKLIANDFSKSNDLAPSTLRGVVTSLRKSSVPLLVLSTLDVGAPALDDATGMQRVAVNVTARVLDLTDALPREVASVPAVQYFGVGPDNASAMNKALKDASLAAARETVSRLNALGVR